MNWSRVTVVTKPTVPALTLEDLKDHARLEVDADDELLWKYLTRVLAQIDGPHGIGVGLMQQTWRLSLDCFPSGIRETLVLPGFPVKSVTSVNYVDTDGADQVVNSSNYVVDVSGEPARVEPAIGQTWPATRDQVGAVWVDYVVGETDPSNIPQDLIDALTLLVAHRYENRGAAESIKLEETPFGVESILNRHRRSFVTA